MAASLSRASTTRQVDPHNWKTWDSYQTIHGIRIEQHSFVDHGTPDTLRFGDFQDASDLYERLERYQFPALSDLRDELEIVTRVLES